MDTDHEQPSERELWSSLPFQEGRERGRAYFDLSLIAFSNGQHRKSLALAESACDCYSQEADDVAHANCLTTVAFNLYELKRRGEAIQALRKSVELFEKTFDNQEWEYRNNLARWLKEENLFEKAKDELEKCLEHFQFEGDEIPTINAYEQLGELLCDMDDCEGAIKNFQAARTLQRDRQDPFWVAHTDVWLARCYNHLKDGVSAQAYALKAIGVFDSTKHRTKQAQGYAQLGRAFNNLGEFEKALEALEKAHDLVTGVSPIDFYAIYVIQSNKVRALRGLGRDREAEVLESRNELINDTLQWGKE